MVDSAVVVIVFAVVIVDVDRHTMSLCDRQKHQILEFDLVMRILSENFSPYKQRSMPLFVAVIITKIET